MTIRAQILSALDKALEAGRHSGAALEAVTEEFASSLRNLQMPPARAFGPVVVQTAPAFAAAVLIRAHHLLGLSTRKTVDWWFEILGSPSEQIRFVAEVVGIKVSGPVELAPNMRLFPLSEEPMSIGVRDLAVRRASGNAIRLVGQQCMAEITLQANAHAVDGEEARTFRAGLIQQRLIDAVNTTALVGCSPYIQSAWWEFSDPRKDLAVIANPLFPTLTDGLAPLMGVDLPPNFREVIAAYAALPEEKRAELSIALARLSAARRRFDIDDKAIEACIALESVFSESDDSGDITYRLSTRLANYSGQSLSERTQIRKLAKDAYRARSKGVHGARSKLTYDEVHRFIDLLAAALREIVIQGGTPKWSEFDLSPPPLEQGGETG